MGKGDQDSGTTRSLFKAAAGNDSGTRHHKRAVGLGTLLTVGWFAAYGWHVADAVGFENLQDLMPAELAQIIIAFISPAVFVWVVIGYVMRGRDLERQTSLLAQQLNMLTYPNPQAEQRVANVADAIRRQTIELKAATEDAATALSQIEHRFQHQRGDLDNAAQAVRNETETVETQLGRQRELLAQMQATLTDQKAALRRASEQETATLESLAADAADRVVAAFEAKRQDIGDIIERVLDHGSSVRDAVERQAEILANSTEKAMGGLKNELAVYTKRLDEAGESARREGRALVEAGDQQLLSINEIVGKAAREFKQQLDALNRGTIEAVETGKRNSAEAELALRQVVSEITAQAGRHANDVAQALAMQLQGINAAKAQAIDAGEELQAGLAAQAARLAERTTDAFALMRGEIAQEIVTLKESEDKASARYRELDHNMTTHLRSIDKAVEAASSALQSRALSEQASIIAVTEATETRINAVLSAIEQQSRDMHGRAEESAERFGSSLRRHHELVSATATATVGEVMRKTAEIQRQMREEGDLSLTTAKSLAEDFTASLARIGEIVAESANRAKADNALLEETTRLQSERLTGAALAASEQFRTSLDRMSGDTAAMMRALMDKISEQNQAAKSALRTEAADFQESTGRLGEQIGQRFAEMQKSIEAAAATANTETVGLVAAVDAQGARLSIAADAAAQRLHQQIDVEAARLGELAAAADQRHDDLVKAIENAHVALSGAADSHADRFGILLKRQEDRLGVLQDVQEAASRRLGESVDAQGHALEQAADRAANKLAQRLRENETTLSASITALVAETKSLDATVGAQPDRLKEAGEAASNQMRNELDSHAARLEVMATGIGKKLEEVFAAQDSEIERLAAALGLKVTGFGDAIQSAGDGAVTRLKGEIERQISSMEDLTATLITRTTALDGTILSQRDHLTEAAAAAAEGFRDILRRQADEFVTAAEAVASRSAALEGVTHAQRDELIAASKHAAEHFSSALRLQAQEIASATAAAVQQTEGLGAAARVQAESLAAMMAESTRRFEAVTAEHGVNLADAGEKAGIAVREKLAQQYAEIDRRFAEIVGQGEKLHAAADNQSVVLGKASEQAAQVAIAMRDALAEQAKQANIAGLDINEKALEAGRLMQRQTSDLSDALNAIVQKNVATLKAATEQASVQAIELGQSLGRQNDELAAALSRTQTATSEIRDALKSQIDELSAVTQKVQAEASMIGTAFRAEADTLREAAEKATGTAGDLQQRMREGLAALDDIATAALAKAADLHQDVTRQSELVKQATEEGGRRTAELAGLYEGHARQLSEASEGARDKLEQMGKSLAAQAEILSTITDQSVGRQQQLNVTLGQRVEQLATLGKESQQQLSTLNVSSQSLAEFLRTTTSESTRQAKETIQLFRDGAESLSQVTSKAAQQVSGVKAAVAEQITELTDISVRVHNMAEQVRGQLRIQSKEFSDAALAARASAESARDDAQQASEILNQQVESLAQAAARMNQHLSGLGTDIDKRIESMSRAAENALGRVGTIGQNFERQADGFGRALDHAQSKAAELGEVFRTQSLDLAKTSQIALERIDRLREAQNYSSRDSFLRAAAAMIEELNGLALDIHSLLDSEVPEEIWKRFREGDRSIFARRLFRNKDSYVIPAIEQRYSRDERFRDIVDRYMRKFEDLLSQSAKADPEAVLNAAIITADVGKLYLVMAKSLGRSLEN